MPELILITGLQHWPKFSRSRLCRCWAWWALVGQDELLNFWQLGMSCGSNDAIFTSHDWEWQVYSTYIWWWLGDGANECKWHCFTHISCDSETLFSQFPNALLLETSSECGSFNLPNHPLPQPPWPRHSNHFIVYLGWTSPKDSRDQQMFRRPERWTNPRWNQGHVSSSWAWHAKTFK